MKRKGLPTPQKNTNGKYDYTFTTRVTVESMDDFVATVRWNSFLSGVGVAGYSTGKTFNSNPDIIPAFFAKNGFSVKEESARNNRTIIFEKQSTFESDVVVTYAMFESM